MSYYYTAFNHREWEQANLMDFGEFSDRITYINQRYLGDDTMQGAWYYVEAPEEYQQRTGNHCPCGIIYSGTFGNYNSPGADTYTYGEAFHMEDKMDADGFAEAVAALQASPEYLEEEAEEECDYDSPTDESE